MVGGVECDVGDDYRGAVSIDLRALDRVLEVDRVSRAARIQAGVYGPALEDQLRPHGLTLRHFPQSFEFSTLGGWLATRSGGHYATLHTHIDDFVESIRAVTPRGVWESRRLPGSGAGPSPDRALLGSEGILGVITEAWMRLQDGPTFRASATARFADVRRRGRGRARDLADAACTPRTAGCSTRPRRGLTGADDSGDALLLLAFESADHPLDPWIARAVECARDHGGTRRRRRRSRCATAPTAEGAREGAAGSWRNAFIRAPYTRDALVGLGAISRDVRDRVHLGRVPGAARRRDAGRARHRARPRARGPPSSPAGSPTCIPTARRRTSPCSRAAPSPTSSRSGRRSRPRPAPRSRSHGGTITHHHAVGRDHRRWYDRQRPEPFAAALRAAKAAVDPAGILNPGVLVDPAVPTDLVG